MEMTAVDERRLTEFFEHFEPPEGFKAELIRGEIVMMGGPDWVHNKIVTRVLRQIPEDGWEAVTVQDVAIPGEVSELVPDLTVVEEGAFDGPGRLVPAPAVTMVVEVVSKGSVHRDYVEKRSIYAAGCVPVYLIIDPIVAQCVLLTDPAGKGEDANYLAQRVIKFGDPVALEAIGIKLETGRFDTLPDVRPHHLP